MTKKFERALFVFRRDLRLEDNTGLIFALQNAKEVIPAFIFTPEQIEKNAYRSDRCLQFMIESLEDLEAQLYKKKAKLYLFFGNPEKIVEECIKKLQVDLVAVNRDYTPYSIKRDQKIKTVCNKQEVSFQSFDDALLHPPEKVMKSNGTPYSIFTPYYRTACKLSIPAPTPNRSSNYFTGPIKFSEPSSLYKKILPSRFVQQKGGRKEALHILERSFPRYASLRDFPAKEGSMHVSAHLKFTTCSPREVYQSVHKNKDLVRSLHWRDFFTAVAYFFPRVFQGSFHEKFDEIDWSYDKKAFHRWCEGTTGFRMITASFLVKDLHIDWRQGEKYFAQKLIDYDPAVNNGNWQWAASTGCDAQPYFRIFNPWNQQKKFDPACEYIFRWIPELSSLSPKIIHEWNVKADLDRKISYPHPMIDHAKESQAALRAYRAIR